MLPADPKKCRRCATPKPATETVRFVFDGDALEIDLCDVHRSQFDRELGAWARIARDVTPTSTIESGRFSITRDREQTERRPISVFAPPRPEPGVVVVQKLPPTYHDWSLTDHAILRCGQRNVLPHDALLTAADPQIVYPPSPKNPRTQLHLRGDIACVVDTTQMCVVTVRRRDEIKGDWTLIDAETLDADSA